VEQSNSANAGKDLTVSAGRTVNYQLNSNFLPQTQALKAYEGIDVDSNGNVWVCEADGGSLYKQVGGTGNFTIYSTENGFPRKITVAINGDIYISIWAGGLPNIKVQLAGAGAWNNVTVSNLTGSGQGDFCSAPNGDIYFCTNNVGQIYKRTGGVGNFVSLAQSSLSWTGLASNSNGDIYACAGGADIYKQTGGIGNFVALGQTARNWSGITVAPNGNVYATVAGGDVYVQINGSGTFNPLNQTSRNWSGIASHTNGNVYAVVYSFGSDIYMQNNSGVGIANLDGGTYKTKAGTGKGTGKSRWQAWTGQKTVSGTDMQVETLRMEIDEEGLATLPSTTTTTISADATGKAIVTKEYLEVLGVGAALEYKTYFVNSVSGNNATGIYQDSTKPYATIDYVLALPAFKSGDIVFLQNNNGVFPLNGLLPNATVNIFSDVVVTLDFSANNNGNILNDINRVFIDIKKGTVKNERNGGTGCYLTNGGSNVPALSIIAETIYHNCSNYFAQLKEIRLEVVFMTVSNAYLGAGFSQDFVSNIVIKTFNCLSSNASVCSNSGRIPIRISNIIGVGSYSFGSGKTIVGNISTTGTSTIGSGEVHFENSTITSAGGILLSGDSGAIISGVIVSTNLFGYNSHSQNGTVRLVNFVCDFKLGFLKLFGGSLIIENSSIKSTNSPIAFQYQGSGSVTLKNSVFEVVNSVPLITCGAGETRTVKVTQISSNATMISDQEGTGVTVIDSGLIGKEIKLINYPNTRNDGALPSNRILSTDSNGNIKLYTIATAPAPYLEVLIPDSTLPSTTTNFVLKGAFFTPTMTVSIVGQTINYITFVSDNEVKVNVTTGATEGSYAVTLNNGIQAVFPNALLIVLGTVYTPEIADWVNIVQPIDVQKGQALVKTANSIGTAELNFLLDKTKKYSIYFNITKSPLITATAGQKYTTMSIIDTVNSDIYDFQIYYFDSSNEYDIRKNNANFSGSIGWHGGFSENIRFYWDLTQMYVYRGSTLIYTFSAGIFPNTLKAKFTVQQFDNTGIKYVEHF